MRDMHLTLQMQDGEVYMMHFMGQMLFLRVATLKDLNLIILLEEIK